ncbi:hypothetical protein MSAN_01455600 [Mycena sanguinolenta]|uniref:GmrSD restriction endonucleases N-terminal domain-containing protein n=1 Tax=Mycena sanguinolenta TaxID=230812 RepID=A0A8H7CYL1_9AGAR|nr:hypothetical protein MSAN_01455600 [Mycena sanguinolenta]
MSDQPNLNFPGMNSPISQERGSASAPLPSSSRMDATAPQKSPYIYEDDDGYDSEPPDENGPKFSIQGQFIEPKTEILTIRELHSLIHEGTIDLCPIYQRDVVWPPQKQALLIDSLFRKFYVPPVIFAVTKDEDGVPIRVCVDGKQRLTSIQRFLDGQLAYVQSKKSWYYTCPESSQSTKQKLQLPDEVKREFDAKPITCGVLRLKRAGYCTNLRSSGVQRLDSCNGAGNLPASPAGDALDDVSSMALMCSNCSAFNTGQKKLAAIHSPWTESAPFFTLPLCTANPDFGDGFQCSRAHIYATVEEGLSTKLSLSAARGREWQNVAHFVYCCDGYPESENVPTPQKMDKWLSRVDPPGQQFKQEIDGALAEFLDIASDKAAHKIAFANNQNRIAPIEFVFIGVLIYVLRKATRTERAQAIYHLRTDIREQFLDIRFNGAVGAAMWRLIRHLKHSPTTSISSIQSATVTPKRKRRISNGSDDEYHPSPIRSLGRNPKTRSRRD